MGHITIMVINYQYLMVFTDIKMILVFKKTTPPAHLGNSPFSLRRHRLESLCYQLIAKWYQ